MKSYLYLIWHNPVHAKISIGMHRGGQIKNFQNTLDRAWNEIRMKNRQKISSDPNLVNEIEIRVGRKNRDGTVGKPWAEIYFFLALFIHTWQEFSQDFETISHFCGTDFFFKLRKNKNIMSLIL
jgi:hypothetical protein